MNSIKLLTEHPLSAQVIHDYYLNGMLNSLHNNSLPEEFKNFVKEKGLEMYNIAEMIDGNPRTLFDVFDEQGIFINVSTTNNGKSFQCDVSRDLQGESQGANTRKEADLKGVILAMGMLEKKLNSLEKTNEDS
jgi:hypothetical protein